MSVIHGAPGVAVQAHPPAALTLNDPDAPAAGTDWLAGEIVGAHPLTWMMVAVSPAIVTVPRRSPSLFAATASWTEPLPEPLPPDAIVIQPALLEAFHEHPAETVTATAALPPPLPTLWLAGEMEYEHPAAWVTVNVCPPAVIVPVRCGPVFALAE
jgi:hypothetical protein